MVDRGCGKESLGVELLKRGVCHWPSHTLLEIHTGSSALQVGIPTCSRIRSPKEWLSVPGERSHATK